RRQAAAAHRQGQRHQPAAGEPAAQAVLRSAQNRADHLEGQVPGAAGHALKEARSPPVGYDAQNGYDTTPRTGRGFLEVWMLRIRLRQMGKKRQHYYRVVVA